MDARTLYSVLGAVSVWENRLKVRVRGHGIGDGEMTAEGLGLRFEILAWVARSAQG